MAFETVSLKDKGRDAAPAARQVGTDGDEAYSRVVEKRIRARLRDSG